MASRAKNTAHAGTPQPIKEVADAPVYLLHGGDDYLISNNGRELVDRFCPAQDQALGLETIDGREATTVSEAIRVIGACLDAVQTVGFFGVEKVVWFRDIAIFGNPQVIQSETVKVALEKLVAEVRKGLQDGVRLIIGAPNLDKRQALYRACKDAGVTLDYAMPDKAYLREKAALSQVAALFSVAHLSASPDVISRFVETAGTDTRQLVQEVEKVRAYLGDSTTVTEAAVTEIVSPGRESSGWELANAIGERKPALAIRILRQLLFQGESPVRMIFRIEQWYRELLIFRCCLERKWCSIARSYRDELVWGDEPEIEDYCSSLSRDPRTYNPYRALKLAEQAQRNSRKDLVRGLDHFVEVHQQLVSSSLPKDLILELAILRVVGGGE
jgi:DNA polymerase-3 subunit delta